MKKKSFVLLEVLIALSLVALCLIPLVKQPLKLYKEEFAYLERMELERLADWTFTEVKELLLKNEIPWEKIPEKNGQTDNFPLPPMSIDIAGFNKKKVERSFFLTGRGEKPGLKGEVYRQLGVYIWLNEQKFSFRTPVEKVVVE